MNDYRYPWEEDETPARRRAPRGRYRLTEQGAGALETYKGDVQACHQQASGREALEEAQKSWASTHGVEPRDALLLGELADRPQTATELQRGLDDCGMKPADVRKGLERLERQGYVEQVSGR